MHAELNNNLFCYVQIKYTKMFELANIVTRKNKSFPSTPKQS